jgi:hypothetical protein
MSGKPIDDAVLEAFQDAMESAHGYRPQVFATGVLVNSRDADRFDGYQLALTAAQQQGQPAAVDDATIPAWRVMPFTGSWKSCDERWEVYSPDGSGGVVLASEVRSRAVADLLDALATQHQEPPSRRPAMSANPIDEAVSVTLHSDRAGCEWFIVTSKNHPDSESEVTPSDDPALFDLLKALTAAQQQGQEVAWQDEWRAAVVEKLSAYGLSKEGAAVFAASELDEYRAGLCDCAENDPADMVDLMMGVARDAIEIWKTESAGRPFGHKDTAPPSTQRVVVIDGRSFPIDTVRTALLGLAADVLADAAEPKEDKP